MPVLASVAGAVDLPTDTQAAMRELNLEASLLSDIDEELKIPNAWIERARKGPPAKVFGTWDPQQFQKIEPANETWTAAKGGPVVMLVQSPFEALGISGPQSI